MLANLILMTKANAFYIFGHLVFSSSFEVEFLLLERSDIF